MKKPGLCAPKTKFSVTFGKPSRQSFYSTHLRSSLPALLTLTESVSTNALFLCSALWQLCSCYRWKQLHCRNWMTQDLQSSTMPLWILYIWVSCKPLSDTVKYDGNPFSLGILGYSSSSSCGTVNDEIFLCICLHVVLVIATSGRTRSRSRVRVGSGMGTGRRAGTRAYPLDPCRTSSNSRHSRLLKGKPVFPRLKTSWWIFQRVTSHQCDEFQSNYGGKCNGSGGWRGTRALPIFSLAYILGIWVLKLKMK